MSSEVSLFSDRNVKRLFASSVHSRNGVVRGMREDYLDPATIWIRLNRAGCSGVYLAETEALVEWIKIELFLELKLQPVWLPVLSSVDKGSGPRQWSCLGFTLLRPAYKIIQAVVHNVTIVDYSRRDNIKSAHNCQMGALHGKRSEFITKTIEQ